MAGLNGTITIQGLQYRPCMVDGKRALFHKWEHLSYVMPPSLMIGGHNGGTVQYVVGIIEYEDGTVKEVPPEEIRFTDNPMKDYASTKLAEPKQTPKVVVSKPKQSKKLTTDEMNIIIKALGIAIYNFNKVDCKAFKPAAGEEIDTLRSAFYKICGVDRDR